MGYRDPDIVLIPNYQLACKVGAWHGPCIPHLLLCKARATLPRLIHLGSTTYLTQGSPPTSGRGGRKHLSYAQYKFQAFIENRRIGIMVIG